MSAPAEGSAPSIHDNKLAAELVPEQVLPKVLTTFGLAAIYVFIIYYLTGSSIISTSGWSSMAMWVLGFLVFLIPAGLAVVELGNLWPAQGGVYVWAYRTTNELLSFVGGFLSWIPVILAGATTPAAALAFLSLAFDVELGLTTSILAQLIILWIAIGLALRKLAITQRVMYTVAGIYAVLCVLIFAVGVIHAVTDKAETPATADTLFTLDFSNYGWVFGLVLLYLLGVETPFNMGAEFLSVKNSAAKMVFWGSLALAAGYIITTIGILLGTPIDEIDSVTGVIRVIDVAGVPGLMNIAAIALAVIMVIALVTYESAYSRLIFVSGLERHLPRLFTHLNPRTRNPVTAILVQGSISSVMIVVLYSQSSLEKVFLYLQGSLTVMWLFSGFFFFVPLAIARYKYADRYASESFWRIPGGRPVALAVSAIGSVATGVGIYYAYTGPFSPDISQGEWMTWVGGVTLGFLIAMALIYVFGRRSAGKLSEEDALAHLAVLELDKNEPAKA